MFNSNTGVSPSLADIAAVTGNNANDMWGNGAWWIILIVILFGWGGNGWGNGFGGGSNNAVPYIMNSTTDNEISRGFDNLALSNKLDAISGNLTNGFYGQNTAILQGFGNLNTNLCGSFDVVNSNINNLGFQLQNSLLQVSNAMDGIKYENAQNTASIISACTANTQRLMDHMTQSEIQDLRDRLQASEFDSNQAAQTKDILQALLPTPRPAYVVASPYQSQSMGYCGCTCGA